MSTPPRGGESKVYRFREFFSVEGFQKSHWIVSAIAALPILGPVDHVLHGFRNADVIS